MPFHQKEIYSQCHRIHVCIPPPTWLKSNVGLAYKGLKSSFNKFASSGVDSSCVLQWLKEKSNPSPPLVEPDDLRLLWKCSWITVPFRRLLIHYLYLQMAIFCEFKSDHFLQKDDRDFFTSNNLYERYSSWATLWVSCIWQHLIFVLWCWELITAALCTCSICFLYKMRKRAVVYEYYVAGFFLKLL